MVVIDSAREWIGVEDIILLAGVGERPINCNLLVEVLLLASK